MEMPGMQTAKEPKSQTAAAPAGSPR